jgi:hypothetical protein
VLEVAAHPGYVVGWRWGGQVAGVPEEADEEVFGWELEVGGI